MKVRALIMFGLVKIPESLECIERAMGADIAILQILFNAGNILFKLRKQKRKYESLTQNNTI